jgi:hypothetical protein
MRRRASLQPFIWEEGEAKAEITQARRALRQPLNALIPISSPGPGQLRGKLKADMGDCVTLALYGQASR